MTTPLPVLIVGGGIAGLAAAWELQQRGLPYTLLEASARLGGKIGTEITPDGYLIEQVADAFIIQKPHGETLARELGLEPHFTHPRDDTRNLYFLKGGKLLPFPPRLKLFVPLEDQSFLDSGVMSPEGLHRFLDEQNVPPKPTTTEDESLESFISRRFGEEALNFVVPLMAGIYVAKASELSMQAAFPQYLEMEQKYGSVIKAVRAINAEAEKKPQRPVFLSFKGGMQTLIHALQEQLTGDIRLNTPVTAVDETSVTLEGGETLQGSAVIVAAPAWKARELLAKAQPQAAQAVAALKSNGSVAVALGYRAEQVGHSLKMHGVIVDHAEDTPLSAITLHSSKMHGRAPEGGVLLRAFMGALEPETALAEAKREAARLLDITGEPVLARVLDWRGQNPAYQLGHLQQLERIQAALPPKLRVVGSSYGGVGIPDCIRFARTAAGEITMQLNQ